MMMKDVPMNDVRIGICIAYLIKHRYFFLSFFLGVVIGMVLFALLNELFL